MKYGEKPVPSYKPEKTQLEDFMRKGAKALGISFEEYRRLWYEVVNKNSDIIASQNPSWRRGGAKRDLCKRMAIPDALVWEGIHETILLGDLAHVDTLTRIPNRRSYENELKRRKDVLERSGPRQESDSRFYCLVIDIDLFKKVNDTYGHSVGDTVLTTIASTMRQSLRADEGNFIARVGGEEFCAFIHTSDLQTALSVANRLRENIASIVFHKQDAEDGTFSVTTSIGVSFFDRVDEANTPILEADAALYLAKGNPLNNGDFSEYSKEALPEVSRNQIWYCEGQRFKRYSPESITV